MAETNIDYGVVKRPGNDEDLTPEEADEYLRCAEDFWEFAKHCKVTGPKGETAFEPRSYQVDMLDIINDNRFCVVNAPR